MKTKSTFLIFYILLFANSVFGQPKTTKTSFEDKIVKFENNTTSEELSITIQDKTPLLELSISASTSSGKLDIILIDPQGVKIGEFGVKAQKTSQDKPSFGELNKYLIEPTPGEWKIKVAAMGATGEMSVHANFENDYYIKVPNHFTPNRDGNNNTVTVETHNISKTADFLFNLYNRYGDLVFTTKNRSEWWDGKVDNEIQEPQTYFYIVKAKTISGKEVTETGYTSLQK